MDPINKSAATNRHLHLVKCSSTPLLHLSLRSMQPTKTFVYCYTEVDDSMCVWKT